MLSSAKGFSTEAAAAAADAGLFVGSGQDSLSFPLHDNMEWSPTRPNTLSHSLLLFFFYLSVAFFSLCECAEFEGRTGRSGWP